ncbi:surface lipoprotein assembly modifier [Altererythrobacter arenosus]|uniref:Surface lipoprotein assembly modifier n=1 Tax=Altererythrobacter arenosus TaxID=3032592 RepID=A0ABY8FUQ1_9SPHN|nr:surface lipoprotein assembly modifier [Altererythrobacter sp. CAU 1644]WFL77658.1 surface lipoprotein assembly modifier [Altererythrobacter sp. CAU 1644]
MLLVALVALAQPSTERAPAGETLPVGTRAEIEATGEQMLEFAARALANKEEALAVQILEALLQDPNLPVRNEARFRLAMLAMRDHRWDRAGSLLRSIIDEDPGAQRARLELARVQAEMGQIEASRRTLREAQAGGLPPEVARLVDRFSAALRERKPFGASVQVAIAPDSNVNRATRSDTLGTVIGDFDLEDAARQSSGVGLSLRGEVYYRKPLSQLTSLITRAGLSGDFYRRGDFNDLLAIASIGPEFALGGGRASLLAGGQRRWFGGERFYDALDANLQWQRPLDRRSHLRAGAGYARTNYRINDLQDAHGISGFASYERALSSRSGINLTLGAARQMARDPAYSTASGQLSVTGWREFGRTTLFASASYQHLEADKRLAIYPKRRVDDFYRLSVGTTLRTFEWKGWAPQLRLTWEKNTSPIEIYRYDRWRGEIGLTRAF